MLGGIKKFEKKIQKRKKDLKKKIKDIPKEKDIIKKKCFIEKRDILPDLKNIPFKKEEIGIKRIKQWVELRNMGYTFREIGELFGVSRQRVHQAYKKYMKKRIQKIIIKQVKPVEVFFNE